MPNDHSFEVPYHPSDKVMVTDHKGTPLHLHNSGHLVHPETGQSHGTYSWEKHDGRHMLQVNPKHSGAAYEAGSGEATHPKVAVHAPPMSKGDGEGDFRGGDPAEIEIKKEEKELDKGVKKTQHVPHTEKEARKVLSTMIRRAERGSHHNKVAKAQPGEEAGAFRGGDPEEIRIKREEKMQEIADAGDTGEEGEGEEFTPEEIEEAEEEEKQKEEDKGKSIVSKAVARLSGQQVSPVDTFGDYNPRDANGDPVSLKIQQVDEKYQEPAPVRPGKNQHRPWSEVIGIKLPLSGNPLQELRRYHKQGRIKEMTEAAKMLHKAIHRYETGPLSIWRDDFVGGEFYTGPLVKGVGDAPRQGSHKYVKRWFQDGKWNYEYQDTAHANHGVTSHGDLGGHTVDVHPKFEAAGQPDSAEQAFHFSHRAHLAEGGQFPAQIYDTKEGRSKKRVLHTKDSRDKEGNFKLDKEGLPQVKGMLLHHPDVEKPKAKDGKKVSSLSALEGLLRHPITIKDPYGDDWAHYHPGKDPSYAHDPKKEKVGQVVYDAKSRFNPDLDPSHTGGFKTSLKQHPHKKNVDEFREWAAEQVAHMEAIKREKDGEGSHAHPEDRRAAFKDLEPTFGHEYDPKRMKAVEGTEGRNKVEHTVTNAIERGELGNWNWHPDHLFAATEERKKAGQADPRAPSGSRTISQGVKFKPKDHHQFNEDMVREHGGQLMGTARMLISHTGLTHIGQEPIKGPVRKQLQQSLVAAALAHLPEHINTHNPFSSQPKRLAEHILQESSNLMRKELDAISGGALKKMEQAQTLKRSTKYHGDKAAEAEAAGDVGVAKQRKETAEKKKSELERHLAATGIKKDEEQTVGTSGPESGVHTGFGEVSSMDQARQDVSDQATERLARERGDVDATPAEPEEPSEPTSEGHDQARYQAYLDHHQIKHDDVMQQMKEIYNQDRGRTLYQKFRSGAQDGTIPSFIKDAFEHHTGLKEDVGIKLREPRRKTEKSQDDLFVQFKKAVLYQQALEVLSKADPEEEADPEDQMHYAWREGEPGAYRYMYKDGHGEHIRGTNAPEGHEHHDPGAGPPEVHPHEPTMETAPHMFDPFGRKLNRAAPGEDVQHNDAYDPHVESWSHKYSDEEGNEEYNYLHRDRVGNHRLVLNEAVRHVDAQLEKVREFYLGMIQSQEPLEQAVGLALALVDQASALADGDDSGLLSMKVKDVSLTGNAFKMRYKDAQGAPHIVTAVLDSAASTALHSLAQGKKPGDRLFEVQGHGISQEIVARSLDEQFGLSLKDIRVYHATELFSKEFQRVVKEQPSLDPKNLPRLADMVYGRVMRMMGHQKVDPKLAKRSLVDPVTVEALFMGAVHQHDPEMTQEIEKAYKLHGRTVFQGLPVSIENRKGSVRSWHDPHNNQSGKTKMQHAYGYIRGTKGTDGDHVDVYLGPNEESSKVFVVHQMKAPDFKKFDEDKCMLGFNSGAEAKAAYQKQYDKSGFFGSMTAMSMEEFKKKVGATKNRPQMIKSECSECLKSWGSCEHSEPIEKAFKGSKDTGPVVWTVTVSHPQRTPDEEAFGKWVHSHPQHIHDQHWSAFKEGTKVEDLPEPDHGREYAHGGDKPDTHHPVFDEPETHHFGDPEEEPGEPEEEPAEEVQEDAAKSILDDMLQKLAG